MDELSKLFQSLLAGASPEGSGEAPAKEDTAADTFSADATTAQDVTGGIQEAAPESVEANADTDMDFSGLLGALSPPKQEENQKMQLLSALKPYLHEPRREKLEHAQSLLNTAYSIRAILSSLGGILNV